MYKDYKMQAILLSFEITKMSAKFHDTLQLPGYVPFLGAITGAIRAITAVAATIIFSIAINFTKNVNRKADFAAVIIMNQALIGRGILEMIPFVGGFMLYKQDEKIESLVKGGGQIRTQFFKPFLQQNLQLILKQISNPIFQQMFNQISNPIFQQNVQQFFSNPNFHQNLQNLKLILEQNLQQIFSNPNFQQNVQNLQQNFQNIKQNLQNFLQIIQQNFQEICSNPNFQQNLQEIFLNPSLQQILLNPNFQQNLQNFLQIFQQNFQTNNI